MLPGLETVHQNWLKADVMPGRLLEKGTRRNSHTDWKDSSSGRVLEGPKGVHRACMAKGEEKVVQSSS